MKLFKEIKLNIFLINFIFVFGHLNSQTSSTNIQQNKFEMGLQLGPSNAFFRGLNVTPSFAITGIYSSLSFQYNFLKTFSIRTGINYESKGEKWKQGQQSPGGNRYSENQYLKSRYFIIPVVLRTVTNKKNSLFVDVGVFTGYLKSQTFYEGNGRAGNQGIDEIKINNRDRTAYFSNLNALLGK